METTTKEKLFDIVLASAAVVEYLDVKSLVTFSATQSSIRAKVGVEILRRKGRLHAIKTQCREIVLSNSTGTYLLLRAIKLKDEAFRLTCYEASSSRDDGDQGGGSSNGSIKEGHPFAEECAFLEAHTVADFDKVLMLPDLFYTPSPCTSTSVEGADQHNNNTANTVAELTFVNEDEIAEMEQIVLDMWPWEDREQEMYVARTCGFLKVDPLHPTTVFYASSPISAGDVEVAMNMVDFYKVVMANQLPRDVVEVNRQEAFRIAARRLVIGASAAKDRFPLAVPFFLYALEMLECYSAE